MCEEIFKLKDLKIIIKISHQVIIYKKICNIYREMEKRGHKETILRGVNQFVCPFASCCAFCCCCFLF